MTTATYSRSQRIRVGRRAASYNNGLAAHTTFGRPRGHPGLSRDLCISIPTGVHSHARKPEETTSGGHLTRGEHLPSKQHTCYNNDGAVVFPRVLAGTGFLEQPGSIQSMAVIDDAVSGQTSTWSQFDFEQPVAASLDAIYVVFEVPAGVGCTGVGEGGGPGFGYCEGSQGLSGWMSDNGED